MCHFSLVLVKSHCLVLLGHISLLTLLSPQWSHSNPLFSRTPETTTWHSECSILSWFSGRPTLHIGPPTVTVLCHRECNTQDLLLSMHSCKHGEDRIYGNSAKLFSLYHGSLPILSISRECILYCRCLWGALKPSREKASPVWCLSGFKAARHALLAHAFSNAYFFLAKY